MKFRSILAAVVLCGSAFLLQGQEPKTGDVESTVNQLIPRLGATNVEDRYSAQMELQALAVNSARPGAKAERAAMAKVLAAKATDSSIPQPARVWFVRQLEYIGGAESVPALTQLLNGQDAELKECARRALEKNPAPAASDALLAALRQGGDTKWKIGLIQSLGERRDTKAVEIIKPYLNDQEIAGKAAFALAKIGNSDAIKALWEAYDHGNSGAPDALIFAGDRLVQNGEHASAEKIFMKLYLVAPKDASSARIHGAALVGLAKAAPKEARKHIIAELEGQNPRLQYDAVTAAEFAYGRDKLSAELAPLLPKLSPGAKIYVLQKLDVSAEPQIISAANDGDQNVQIAALEALERVGTAASVPVLIKAAATPGATQKPAAAALARVSGPGADDAIAKLAAQGEPDVRVAAIHALAARNNTSAVPALLKYAAESDQAVSKASCAALSKMASDNEIEPLARLALSGKSPDAEAALQTVAARAKDKPAAAKNLAALVPAVDPQQAGFLFETLTVLGGSDAFQAVTNSAASSNEQIKDAAIRALANWPDFAATGPLLSIAADPNATRVHQVLAIQGVVRLVKSSENERAEARLAAANLAMTSATRDEDKKLVLSAFASVPDPKAADAIKPYLSDAKFEKEAALAGVTLAESLRKTDVTASRNLAEAVKEANVSQELNRKANALLEKN